MPAQWRINYWPDCIAHAFLSHCAEDRRALVLPVYKELRASRLIPWMDQFHYPLGMEGFAALQENLLRCRHVVYFITPALLRQGRGWAQIERAFAAAIQHELRYGDEIAHVELPLVFMPRSDMSYQRSIWLSQKARECPHPAARSLVQRLFFENGMRSWSREHVVWAADMIESFVRQEERWAIELGVRVDQDTHLREQISRDDNLRRRVLALAPRPLPA